MEYIPIILAFAAGLVAIVGHTWDATQSGLKKLTKSGRYALMLVVFSLIYSVVSAYQQRDLKQSEEAEKKKLGKIVAIEIERSLQSLLSPFRHLYIETNGGNFVPLKEITIDKMLNEEMLQKAQNICLELRPKTFYSFPDAGTWNDIFSAGITSGLDRLDRVVDRYGPRMNSDILDAIHDLQTNGYFSAFARRRLMADTETKKETAASTLPPCVIGQAIGSHKKYLSMLKRVETINNSETLIH